MTERISNHSLGTDVLLSVCDDTKFCISIPLSHVFTNPNLRNKNQRCMKKWGKSGGGRLILVEGGMVTQRERERKGEDMTLRERHRGLYIFLY